LISKFASVCFPHFTITETESGQQLHNSYLRAAQIGMAFVLKICTHFGFAVFVFCRQPEY